MQPLYPMQPISNALVEIFNELVSLRGKEADEKFFQLMSLVKGKIDPNITYKRPTTKPFDKQAKRINGRAFLATEVRGSP